MGLLYGPRGGAVLISVVPELYRPPAGAKQERGGEREIRRGRKRESQRERERGGKGETAKEREGVCVCVCV